MTHLVAIVIGQALLTGPRRSRRRSKRRSSPRTSRSSSCCLRSAGRAALTITLPANVCACVRAPSLRPSQALHLVRIVTHVPAAMDVADMKSIAKPERTMTTFHLVVIGFFWTSGGCVAVRPCSACSARRFMRACDKTACSLALRVAC